MSGRKISHGPIRFLWLPIILCFTSMTPVVAERIETGQQPAIPVVSSERFTRLNHLMRSRKCLRVACLGDSLTFGIGTAHPSESFVEQLRAMLQACHPAGNVELTNLGSFGCPADYAAQTILQQRLIPLHPDLVTLQFGGGEVQLKVPPLEFKAGLADLIQGIIDRTPAAVMIIVPPMGDTEADRDIVAAAHDVARLAEIPCADSDAALRRHPHDDRGFFPDPEGTLFSFLHPNGYLHNLMAREVMGAFQKGLGRVPSLDVRLNRGLRLASSGDRIGLSGVVTNLDIAGRVVEVQWQDVANETHTSRQRVILRGHQSRRTSGEPLIPPREGAPPKIVRVSCQASSNLPYASDMAEVTTSPVIRLSAEGDQWEAELDQNHAAMGRSHLASPEDLSATVTLTRTGESVVVDVEVADDSITTTDRPNANYDCVELLWDLRPEELQGAPYWGQGVYLLRVAPPRDPHSPCQWELRGVSAQGNAAANHQTRLSVLKNYITVEGLPSEQPIRTGYACRVTLAAPFFTDPYGRPLHHAGFNLVVVDNDDTTRRQAALTLSGGLEVYSSAQTFDLLWLRDDPLPPRPVAIRTW